MFSLKFKKNINTKSTFNIFLLFFLLILTLIISACTLFPVPPNNLTDLGNIQIFSEPVGASIYLDGSDTSYTSPKLLNNLYPGSYLVTFKLEGYLDSHNYVQIYPNQTTQLNVHLTPNPNLPSPDTKNLLKIEVEPENLVLAKGEIGHIDLITAYYSDGTNEIISANQCYMYSTNLGVAIVTSEGIIAALSEGQTYIWVEYTESSITKRDSILVSVYGSVQDPGNLVSINVLPETMSLDIGESKPISSITAYYDNGLDQAINPDICNFSIDNTNISISNSGIITGNTSGNSVVTVTYSENNITKSDAISVSVSDAIVSDSKYRALAIGVGNYIYYGEDGDLIAPPYDVNKVKNIFYDCRFSNEETPFYTIIELKDSQATKANILQRIQSVFSDASNNDVSYFYFSGHGANLNQVSYLCPADFDGNINSAISVDELETALSAIPGTKVVFIDSCHSGGFIGKDILRNDLNDNEPKEYLANFNESIINTFSGHILSKDLLTSNEYQVLTSSHWFQVSYEIYPETGEPFGVFTQGLYEGCSLSNNIPADSNQNNQISLNEAYNYIAQWVASIRINQDVQVYPLNSSFTIFEY
jgi:hypothetical protein